MADCLEYPEHKADDIMFYVTNIVTAPLVFGAGILASLILLIVLNTKFLRKANPTYAYLNGLAIVDFMSLLLIIPEYIQDSGLLDPEFSHSKIMGYVMNAQQGLSLMCTYTATWYTVLAVVVFLSRLNKTHYKPAWTKISVSRIIAFVIFVASCLLCLPIFFQASVKQVEGHCLDGLQLYGHEPTSLARSVLYTSLYPWIITGVVFLIPYATLAILVIAIPIKIGAKSFCTTKVLLKSATFEKDKNIQLGKCLFVLVLGYIVLETPGNVGELFVALYGSGFKGSPGYKEFSLVSELLHRIRTCIPFVIYVLFDGEFRKSLRRILCCAADEYYEPCACCMSRSLAKEEPYDWRKNEGILQNGSLTSKKKKKRSDSDYSGWV